MRNFLIFFFSIMQVTLAMEHEIFLTKAQNLMISDDYDNIKPIYSRKNFDFSRKTKNVSSVVMMISPIENDESVLIGKKDGIISCFSLKTSNEERLIKHYAVDHIPMFAAAQREGSLFIVSAGNYINEDNIKKSERCIWHKGFCKTNIGSPLQAIAVDRGANLLAMADQSHSISIIDLNTDKVIGPHLFYDASKSDNIMDVAFNPNGTKIIIAKSDGIVLMSWYNGYLRSDKYIKNITDIKNIYFPTPENVVYINRDKKVSMINMAEDGSKTIVFFEKLLHDKVVVDEESGDSAVLWTKNNKAAYDLRHQIVVRKRYPDKIEELILEVPEFRSQNRFTSDEKGEYESKRGCLKEGKHHVCQVALRGNNVVALSSDGKLHWWKIAEEDTASEIIQSNDGEENSTGMPKKRDSLRSLKHRSKSEENKKNLWDILSQGSEVVPKSSKTPPRSVLSSNKAPRDLGKEKK